MPHGSEGVHTGDSHSLPCWRDIQPLRRRAARPVMVSLRLGRNRADLEVVHFLSGRVTTLRLHRDRLAVGLVDDERDGVDARLTPGLVGERDGEVPVGIHHQGDAVVTEDDTRAGARRSEPRQALGELASERHGPGVVHHDVVHRRRCHLRRLDGRGVAAVELCLQVGLDECRGVGRGVRVSRLRADDLDGAAMSLDRRLALDDDRVSGRALSEEVVEQRHGAVPLTDGGGATDVNASDHVARVLPPVLVGVVVLVGPLGELDDGGLLVPAVTVVDDTVSVEVLTPTNRNQCGG